MSKSENFGDVLKGRGSSWQLLAAYFVGVLAAGVLGNWIFGLLTGALYGWPLVGGLGLVGFAYLFYHMAPRWRGLAFHLSEEGITRPHAGLIWLFAPGGLDHLLAAIAFHRREGTLRYCWLLMQKVNPGVIANLGVLQRELEEAGIPFVLTESDDPREVNRQVQSKRETLSPDAPPVLVLHQMDLLTVTTRETRDKVLLIKKQAVSWGLKPEEILPDITSGFKPMAAGMLLAALAQDGVVEYVEAPRNEKGEPDRPRKDADRTAVAAFRQSLRITLVDAEVVVTLEE